MRAYITELCYLPRIDHSNLICFFITIKLFICFNQVTPLLFPFKILTEYKVSWRRMTIFVNILNGNSNDMT